MVGKSVEERCWFFGTQLAGDWGDFVEWAEEVYFLPGKVTLNAAETVQNLRAETLGVNQLPPQSAGGDFGSWE
jgi:hypothetical protein